jgi:hypothetical protein
LYNFGADGVDLTPYLIYIDIVNNTCCSSSGSDWDVNATIYYNSQFKAAPSGESRGNNMNVDDITIGSESSDTRGSAADFFIQDNQWMNGSGGLEYQTTTGTKGFSTNPPPHGFWAVNPCNCQGNTGGSFQTYD